jgi:large subunit ribosomal protein L4
MELKVINSQGQAAGNVAASDVVFAREYNEPLVHQLVVAYQANARSGNRKQKDREEVRHSTKKPFNQKGTGRARAGMTSSPLWRGGGKIFPNSPEENFSHKVNKKMHRVGMCSILSQLAREDRIVIMDDFLLEAPKTKQLVAKLAGLGMANEAILVITDGIDANVALASRNLHNVAVIQAHEADPVSLVYCGKVVMTKAALAKFQELLAGEVAA